MDAIIICGGRIDLAEPDPEFMQLLKTTLATTPIVVGSRSPMEQICGVAVDHKGSVEYLIGLRHRDIGFVYTGQPYYGTQEKVERFRQAMAAAGMPVVEDWMINVQGYDCPSGRDGIDKLMTCSRRPRALLGLNDVITAGMLQGLLEHGVRVPEDISLMGFDDTYITNITSPQLSAVDYDHNKYARMLVDAIIALSEGMDCLREQLIPPSLSVKKSSLARKK